MTFQVRQEKFEGPLDVLLDLIERQKLAISEISLANVTDEYLVYVKNLALIDPEELAEFLVIAAQLMLVKSRSLLPQLEFTEEEEGSIEELQARLQEYQRIRERARDLKRLEGLRRHIIGREAFSGMDPVFYPPTKLGAGTLHSLYSALLAALPKLEKLAKEKIRHIISLEEKIKHIREFLQEKVEHAFSEIVRGSKEKLEVIVSFLAILELAKQRLVDLHQDKLFEDIIIKRRE